MLNKSYKDNNKSIIKMGDIFWVDLGSPGGRLQGGKRPCVIVSNNKNNYFSTIVNIVPLSTKTNKKLPVHIEIDGNKYHNNIKDSIALCEQFRPINKTDIGTYVASLENSDLKRILEGINIQTELDDNLKTNKIEDDKKVINFTFLKDKIDIIKEADKIINKYNKEKDLIKFTLMNKNCAIAELKKYCEEKEISYNRIENIIEKDIKIKNEDQLKFMIR